MNTKRYEILNNCADKLFNISKYDDFQILSSFDIGEILQVCRYFTSHLNEDETFVGNKKVADWFRKIGGFSVEDESPMYHIFIEDK